MNPTVFVATIALLITMNIAVIGGLYSLILKHMSECTQRYHDTGKMISKMDDVLTEVNSLRRRVHRHTAAIGKLAFKANVELGEDQGALG